MYRHLTPSIKATHNSNFVIARDEAIQKFAILWKLIDTPLDCHASLQ